ncbi:MAG: metallopeptidase family protein [Actinomycetota bacterium]
MVDRARFQELAAEAIDGLPTWVHDRMENVDVTIEELAPPDEPNLLGLYQGIPLTQRDGGYTGVMPDRITLYRSTIMRRSGHDEDRVRAEVAHTVKHEVAHFFGISDERLHELDAY